MVNIWEEFWKWIDEKRVIRRIVLFAMLYLTFELSTWTMHFAEASTKTGGDIAAILAAIWGPMSLLQGAVFGFYSNSRSRQEATNG